MSGPKKPSEPGKKTRQMHRWDRSSEQDGFRMVQSEPPLPRSQSAIALHSVQTPSFEPSGERTSTDLSQTEHSVSSTFPTPTPKVRSASSSSQSSASPPGNPFSTPVRSSAHRPTDRSEASADSGSELRKRSHPFKASSPSSFPDSHAADRKCRSMPSRRQPTEAETAAASQRQASTDTETQRTGKAKCLKEVTHVTIDACRDVTKPTAICQPIIPTHRLPHLQPPNYLYYMPLPRSPFPREVDMKAIEKKLGVWPGQSGKKSVKKQRCKTGDSEEEGFQVTLRDEEIPFNQKHPSYSLKPMTDNPGETRCYLEDIGVYTKVVEVERTYFSVIYTAMHRISKTKVVLKRCFSRKSLIESFGKEIYNLQKFQGRGVVKYFENRSFGGDRYIVMEMMETDFHKLFQKGVRFNEADRKAIMRMALHGISRIHERDMVHGDIKASNFLYSFRSGLKFCDFGNATREREPKPDRVYYHNAYRAPELFFKPKELTKACDIWALGVFHQELMVNKPYCLEAKTDLERLEMARKKVQSEMLYESEDFIMMGTAEYRFMCEFVKMSPEDRTTAEQALEHYWFTESPAATPLDQLYNPRKSERGKRKHE